MPQTQVVQSGGIGFLGFLTLLFIGLQLTGYIAWSWWWVLAPLWFPFAIMMPLIAGVLMGGALYKVYTINKRRNR